MKIKIIFLSIYLFLGCMNDQSENVQISYSKSTALSNAIELASPGVVGIYRSQEIVMRTWRGYRNLKPVSSNGSGFIISEDGYILTNAHNIKDNFRPSVITTDINITVVVPGGEAYSASIVGLDMISDIALLKIDGKNFDYCNLGDSDEVKVGEWAIALGNPRNLISNAQYQPIASAGIVSAINADFSLDSQSGKLLDNMIQTDASLNPGNSGGPLIDSNGDVIGINTFIKADSQNLGFAIPINFAKKIADELKLKGVIDRRVSFGLSATQYIYGKNRDQVGLFIDKVDYSDSARNEELFRGDIIVAVEGYKVESLEEIKAVLIKLDSRAGDEIKLTVVRENDLFDVSLTLGEI
jgi:serine protease Do